MRAPYLHGAHAQPIPPPLILKYALSVGTDEVLRVDNNPSRPERGSITVFVEGGK